MEDAGGPPSGSASARSSTLTGTTFEKPGPSIATPLKSTEPPFVPDQKVIPVSSHNTNASQRSTFVQSVGSDSWTFTETTLETPGSSMVTP